MIDDHDAGLCAWGDKNLLVSWFRSDTRRYRNERWIPAAERATWDQVFDTWTDEQVTALIGSWGDTEPGSWSGAAYVFTESQVTLPPVLLTPVLPLLLLKE